MSYIKKCATVYFSNNIYMCIHPGMRLLQMFTNIHQVFQPLTMTLSCWQVSNGGQATAHFFLAFSLIPPCTSTSRRLSLPPPSICAHTHTHTHAHTHTHTHTKKDFLFFLKCFSVSYQGPTHECWVTVRLRLWNGNTYTWMLCRVISMQYLTDSLAKLKLFIPLNFWVEERIS